MIRFRFEEEKKICALGSSLDEGGRMMLARGEFCGGHMQIRMHDMPFDESRWVNLDKDNRFAFPIFNPDFITC